MVSKAHEPCGLQTKNQGGRLRRNLHGIRHFVYNGPALRGFFVCRCDLLGYLSNAAGCSCKVICGSLGSLEFKLMDQLRHTIASSHHLGKPGHFIVVAGLNPHTPESQRLFELRKRLNQRHRGTFLSLTGGLHVLQQFRKLL
jgi:hypothetical protein